MKSSFFLLVILLSFWSTTKAQDNLVHTDGQFPNSKIEEQSSFIKNIISSTQPEAVTFRLRHFNQSKYSKHFTYDVLYNSLPVFGSFIKINTDKKNNVLSIAKGIGNIQDYSAAQFEWEQKSWARQNENLTHWPASEKVTEKYLAIFEENNRSSVVQVQNAQGKTIDKTKIINLAGELVASWNHQRNLGIDTFINAHVFEPDPLTFLSQQYAAPYVDSNDKDMAWMTGAYFPVNIPAVYDTVVNKFFIENDLVKMVDISAPNFPPSESANNNFYFDRSQPGFEEANVAYHITQFHNHISALGFDTLMDLQLEVDAHGGFGDNSVFNRNIPGIPNMSFGDGGVDDAEDADVIVHEYCHGISWSANANTHITSERIALDEGLADYFATSYSRSLSAFRWEDMFTWDGHNEYWGGRSANTINNYTVPSVLSVHRQGEIFNTAMQNIYTDLGRNVTDELMLEALFYFTDSTNLPSAAYYVLQVDDLINGGANKATICKHFRDKNLLSSDCYPTSIANTTKESVFNIKNSQGFSAGTGKLSIDFGKQTTAQIQLFDINGRLLLNQQINNSNFALSPSLYSTGFYILKIQSPRGVQTVKLNRQ